MSAPVGERLRSRALLGARTPGAGSPWLADRLDGPSREVPVIATGPHAVYLRDGATCVAVLDRDAVAVPLGLRTTLSGLPQVRRAEVGGGCVRLGRLSVELVRLLSTTTPSLPGLVRHAEVTRGWLEPGTDPRLDAVHRQLPATVLGGLVDGDLDPLVGRGDGFTPVGDDVVCGWLVTRHALGLPGLTGLPVHRTTTVSGALMLRAAAGEAVPQLRDLLVAVGSGVGADQVHSQLQDLLLVGSSSGAGLAVGAALALVPNGRTP